MSNLKKIKAQLEADIARCQMRSEITMENAKLIESKIRSSEDTLFKFQGMLEGIQIFKNNVLKRAEAVQQDPSKGSLEELQIILNIAGQLETAAQQQFHRQEGTVNTVRGVARVLQEEAGAQERNARAKADQLQKADNAPMNDPQQEPPKAPAKKAAKKKAKKVAKKASKKKSKR